MGFHIIILDLISPTPFDSYNVKPQEGWGTLPAVGLTLYGPVRLTRGISSKFQVFFEARCWI